ncbi:Spectrin beta chain, brain [Quillaja saponaria]|uniref:Spectrin beta chain, brain n=1 Tax=Quillaja saponaria TaxID=32244 RepID=A0AAD7Q4W1_QUISA|nr:Spectrin beta chain, brain [Quillaja saponaria]
MAGNVRVDMGAASTEELAFKGSFPNGQRRSFSSAVLDRSGSFHEGNESQMFSSGASTFRGKSKSTGDLPPLSQYLMLDHITMGDRKYIKSKQVSKMLLSRPEVDQKSWNESLQKLNKFSKALNSKKQQRNEMSTSGRSGGSNLLKLGNLILRNSPELVNHRLEDTTKNIVLNKRVRTSATEMRAEDRNDNLVRHLVIGKERDTLKDGEGSDLVEEKFRKMSGAGETWDRKLKRQRSMGNVFARHVDGDGEMKRLMHLKLNNESALQSSNAQGLSSNVAVASKSELGKVSRDSTDGSNRDRLVLKGNSIIENNRVGGVYTLAKGKASRAPRTGSVMAGDSSPTLPRSSGAIEGWEQPLSRNNGHSLSGANSCKLPLPTGSASPPMAQWVGQRSQKNSRPRRANLVSPVLNSDEVVQISSEGCSPSDIGTRMTTSRTNGSLLVKGAGNSTHEVRLKHETASSAARLSENEESGAGENGDGRLKEIGSGSNKLDERAINNSQNVCSSVLLLKRYKINKEESGDGMQRQGRSGTSSSLLRTSILPMREKLETPTLVKPTRNTKLISEKNGSNSGRPPIKKLSNRKASTRLGHASTSRSPDFIGESDDDREELLTAANFSCNASYIGCSSSFWKKLEPIFAPLKLEDTAFLKQLLNSIEENHESWSQMLGLGHDASDDHVDNDVSQDQRERSLQDQIDMKEFAVKFDIVDQHGDADFSFGRGSSKRQILTPLYQRVLSALIVEGQTEVEETFGEGNMSLPNCGDESPHATCFPEVAAYTTRVRTEFPSKSISGSQAGNQWASNKFACNGNSIFTSNANILDEALNEDLLQVHQGSLDLGTEMFPMLSQNNNDELDRNFSHSSSFHCAERMCLEDKLLLELQSVGLYPETVPDLADGEDEAINQDIIQLQKGLHQQVGKKKAHLKKLTQAFEESREIEIRSLEHVAMNKLVELAYKKKLATRASSVLRSGLPKVSKQVATAFMKRTLARCQKFEDTGKSCFVEPALRDAIFSASTRGNDAEYVNHIGQTGFSPSRAALHDLNNDKAGSDSFDVPENLSYSCDQGFVRTGTILNRGKKKELMLDDVGASASLRADSLLGGAKGKRSERERDKDTLGKGSTKSDCPSLGYLRGERKTKAKPKQKTAQLSTTKNGFASGSEEVIKSEHPSGRGSGEEMMDSRKRKVGSLSHSHNPEDTPKELEEPINFTDLKLHGLDSMELGVVNELDGHQDLGSWLNIDEDGWQDNDSMGLDIPMDDLSDLQMLL